jgi:hypothetical protein
MIIRIAPGALLACLLVMFFALPARAELHYVTRGQSNRIVIFVDALRSDPGKFFRWGEGVASWPELMAGDSAVDSSQLPLARYDSAVLSFGGGAEDRASVPQLATRALSDLKAKGAVEGYQSIIFVAHGAGGLVLKSMLVQSSNAGAASLAAKTKVVFLLSVPAEGRAAATFLTTLAQNQGLAVDFGSVDVSVFLQGLDTLWSEYLARRSAIRRLEIYCRSETDPSFGLKVAAGQYTTGGCDDTGQETGTDHNSIAKPASRDSTVYKWVRHHLADYFQRFPSDPGKAPEPAPVASAEGVTTNIPVVPPPATLPAAAAATLPEAPPPARPAAASASAVAAANQPANDLIPVAPASQSATGATAGKGAAGSTLARTGRTPRNLPPIALARPLRGGDWTFALKDSNCNLNTQLWVVQLHDRHLTSESWDTRIASDGRFTINAPAHCGTEAVRGQVSGIYGSGWYNFSDQCLQIYCRTKFTLTWRQPVPQSH